MACQDANTGIAVYVTSVSPNVAFSLAASGTGNTRTITIQTNESGFFDMHFWLSDSPTDPTVSLVLPDGGGGNNWFEPTNASGVLTKDVTHSGTHTWYVWATLIGPIGVLTSQPLIFT